MPTDSTACPDSALQAHLTGWYLSAGDEHRVFDANHSRIVDVPCGGMTGRTFAEATDVARLIVNSPKLMTALHNLEAYLRDTPHHNAPEAAAARSALRAARGELA
jgi:hypothetical protein